MAGESRARAGLSAARTGGMSLRATVIWWIGLSTCGWVTLTLLWTLVAAE